MKQTYVDLDSIENKNFYIEEDLTSLNLDLRTDLIFGINCVIVLNSENLKKIKDFVFNNLNEFKHKIFLIEVDEGNLELNSVLTSLKSFYVEKISDAGVVYCNNAQRLTDEQ